MCRAALLLMWLGRFLAAVHDFLGRNWIDWEKITIPNITQRWRQGSHGTYLRPPIKERRLWVWAELKEKEGPSCLCQ